MKCSTCQNNECERNFDNKAKCLGKKEEIDCSCTCQVSAAEEIATSLISIGTGIGAAAGGVVLTVMTGGLLAIIGGAALIGAGSTMILNPIQRKITGERLTLSDSATDIALSATIGELKIKLGLPASVV